MAHRTSCGVIVTDDSVLLLGHATRSPRWDIPKGLAEPGEDFRGAARRELWEETSLSVPDAALHDIGVHGYMPGKDLALFVWRPVPMPDPRRLVCHSSVTLPNGTSFPEFDRFGLFAWDDALTRVGKNLARLLGALRPMVAGHPTAARVAPETAATPVRGRSHPAHR